jgi:hypothetical protein
MQAASWEPGEVVVWREAWRGRVYFGWPVRVVQDSAEQLAVYVAEGTKYAFTPGAWPFGAEHPWAGRDGWEWEPDPSWPVPELPDDWNA